jgi:hypothetical protein
VFAAKNARSFPEFLVKFFKYFLILMVVLFVIGAIYAFLFRRDYFDVPKKPSGEGDKTMVTPAGNVIKY